MKILYRHEDGRLIEVSGDGNRAEVWLLYPHRELLETASSLEDGKEKLPEGFSLDSNAFSPPCPKCEKPAPLDIETGMYLVKDCDDPRCGCPF
jgi:hypothetical protein